MWASRGWQRAAWTVAVEKVLHHWPLQKLDVFTLPDDPDIQMDAIDSWMVHRLFWFGRGGYEPGEGERWAAACGQARRVVEIGANVGWYTVLGARANPAAAYVAIEPQPAAANSLRRNVQLNGLTNVEVIEAAVVGVDGPPTVRLNFPDATLDNPAPGRAFVSGAEFQLLPSHRAIDVPTVSAQAVIAGADLLKLDIEGLEADVLSGAEAAIAAARPTIFIEMQPEAHQLRALVDRWRSEYGYSATSIGWNDVVLTAT